jgi:hypothetical protein
MKRIALFLCLATAVGLVGPAGAQDLASFERRLTEHRLDNGLTVDWIERRPTFNGLRTDVRYRELVEQSTNRG